MMEKNEAVNVLLSCIQWNSEMFTFEIEENQTENGVFGGFSYSFEGFLPSFARRKCLFAVRKSMFGCAKSNVFLSEKQCYPLQEAI